MALDTAVAGSTPGPVTSACCGLNWEKKGRKEGGREGGGRREEGRKGSRIYFLLLESGVILGLALANRKGSNDMPA